MLQGVFSSFYHLGVTATTKPRWTRFHITPLFEVSIPLGGCLSSIRTHVGAKWGICDGDCTYVIMKLVSSPSEKYLLCKLVDIKRAQCYCGFNYDGLKRVANIQKRIIFY